jgi:(R,R)-butanediol dehydrogenase / meso-butanediol dehydrogenase / diacetyl reductase
MRAARWHGPGDVRVEEVAEPAIRHPADVLVEVDAAMICASDFAEWRNGPHVIPVKRPHPLTGMTAPVTLGHEYVGRVSAVGADVRNVAVGDRVCGDACLRCNRCYWCLRGEYNICEKGASVGLHADGAFAPALVVPDYTLVPVPAGVSDQNAAVVEPLAVGLHALRQTRMAAGDTVVVIGFGMIGAACTLLANATGAAQVIVVELSEQRARLAAQLGADLASGPGPDLRRTVRSRTSGRGADVILECTGRPGVVGDAVELSRRGGRIGLCGIPHEPSSLRTDRLVYFEREIVGCLGYRFDHDTVIGLLANGSLNGIKPIFADPVDLADVVRGGFERMASDPDVPLRIPLSVR